MSFLLKLIEPLVNKYYPKIAMKAIKKALKLQEQEVLRLIEQISDKGYTAVIMMNPATTRGVLEIAAAETEEEQKKEAKKRRFEVITNDDE